MSDTTTSTSPNALVDWLRNREPVLVALLAAFLVKVIAAILLKWSIHLSGDWSFWINQVLLLVLGIAALAAIRKLVVPLGKLQKALGDIGTKLLLSAADKALPAGVTTPEGSGGVQATKAGGTTNGVAISSGFTYESADSDPGPDSTSTPDSSEPTPPPISPAAPTDSSDPQPPAT